MRKLAFLMTFIFGIFVIGQMSVENVTFAKSKSKDDNKRQIAIVVVSSDADFKTKSFTNQARKDLKKNNKKNKFKFIPDSIRGTVEKSNSEFTVLSGDEIQNKYHDYWFDKGMLQEGNPTREDFVNFVSYSGYDKVIYLLVNNPTITQTGAIGSTIGAGNTGTVIYTNSYSAAVTIDAFLVDKNKIIKTANASKGGGSKWSAFKQSIRSISEVFNPLL